MTDAAIGIVFNADKTAVLVIRRQDVPIWVLPGGGIDPGETAEEAVVREVLEETGYIVKVKRRTAEYTPLNRLAHFAILFECDVVGGEPRLSDETTAVGFYPIDKLPAPFFHLHRDWLSDALAHPNTTVHKPIHQVTYWNLAKYFIKHPIRVIQALLARLGAGSQKPGAGSQKPGARSQNPSDPKDSDS
jgi:8-oxo-dGTP diphosphatase